MTRPGGRGSPARCSGRTRSCRRRRDRAQQVELAGLGREPGAVETWRLNVTDVTFASGKTARSPAGPSAKSAGAGAGAAKTASWSRCIR